MKILSYAGTIILLLCITTTGQAAGRKKMSGAALFKNKLAMGLTYTGAQLRWGFSETWAVESRLLIGKNNSEATGESRATFLGLRGYFTFLRDGKFGYYTGIEAGRVGINNRDYQNYDFKPSGYATGTFAGLEYHILPRLSLGVDIGPYYISIKDGSRGLLVTHIDIIANSFINWYFL